MASGNQLQFRNVYECEVGIVLLFADGDTFGFERVIGLLLYDCNAGLCASYAIYDFVYSSECVQRSA